MRIDCRECAMYRSEHCNDCLVTALVHPPEGELDIEEELGEPLGALADAGLVPVLRFRPRADRSPDQVDAPGADPPGSAAGAAP